MERGLMWMPLLVLFFWLAWAGRNEYTKLEAYKVWAATFDRAKYDIRAVMGQSGDAISWGQPDRPAPKNVQTFSLKGVSALEVVVDGAIIDPQNPPTKGKTIGLVFVRPDQAAVTVPFTQVDLAAQWAIALQKDLGQRVG